MDLDSVKPLLQKSEKQSRGWDEDSDTSDWSGVVFDESDRIKGLFLSPGNITGELPRSLGKMAFLEQLHVASNDLCGESIRAGYIRCSHHEGLSKEGSWIHSLGQFPICSQELALTFSRPYVIVHQSRRRLLRDAIFFSSLPRRKAEKQSVHKTIMKRWWLEFSTYLTFCDLR